MTPINLMDALKPLTHSPNAERAVLGGLLLNCQALDRITDLRADHFFTDAHRRIFNAIRDQIDDAQSCDVLLIAERLHKNSDLGQCGGLDYLHELTATTPSATNIRQYAEIVRERWQIRTLAHLAEDIADAAYANDGQSARAQIESAQTKIMGLTEHASSARSETFAEIMAPFNEMMRRRQSGEITGIPSGFEAIDSQVQFERGNLVIVGARPAMGKSAYASQWSEQAAKRGHKSLIFSMEMTKHEMLARSLSRESGIMLSEIISGRASGSPVIAEAQHRLSRLPVSIDDSAPAPIHEIRAKARDMKRRQGLDLLVLDYLQLMPGTGGAGKNRNEDLSDVTRGLKALAKELDIVVIALSQLSRKCEDRPDKRPMLSDLRDSGGIEQDADIVMMLYRHEKYYPNDPDWHGVAECNVVKYRNGATGTIPLIFDGALTQFKTYTGRWPFAKKQTSSKRGFSFAGDE